MTLEELITTALKQTEAANREIPWNYELRFAGHPGEQYNCTPLEKDVSVDHENQTINIWL